MAKCLIITGRDPSKLKGGDIERLKSIIHFYNLKYNVDIVVTGSRRSNVTCYKLENTTHRLICVKNTRFKKLLGIAQAIFDGQTLQQGIYANRFVVATLNKILCSTNYDVVVFHLFRNYSSDIITNAKIHVDLCDCQSYNYSQLVGSKNVNFFKRYLYRYELRKTILVEKDIAEKRNIAVSFINKNDCKYFQTKYTPECGIHILPNYYKIKSSFRFIGNGKIAVVGNFNSFHNNQMIKSMLTSNIFSDLRSKLVIVGQMSVFKSVYLNFKGLTVVRNPEDVLGEIAECSFGLSFLAFNSGFQTKLIDYANASLVPIVSSNVAQGADLYPNSDCTVIQSIEDVISIISTFDQKAESIAKNFQLNLKAKAQKCESHWKDFMDNCYN